VTEPAIRRPLLRADVLERALGARDPRFDGIFFVGITTTRVYCRPVCPARVSYHDHRRFFDSAAAAEGAGFRPCLRCRPELAPGRAPMDAVPRLASAVAHRIGAGALNGRSVRELAGEFGVSERHLRRALEREIGVSPIELAQTHRLLLAKRLLADTSLSVTRIAFACGFQSLRRFNSVFRERYRMSPSAVRRAPGQTTGARDPRHRRVMAEVPEHDLLRLTLAYRAPLAWDVLTGMLRGDAIPGVEFVEGRRYGRTIRLEGRTGVILAEDAGGTGQRPAKTHVNVDISPSLLPVLMPLLARLRQLFDLDAEPAVIDAHLEQGGLATLVRQRPGVRLPGAIDGFEIAVRALLRAASRSEEATTQLARRMAWELGEPIETGIPSLTRIAPSAERVAQAGAAMLESLGLSRRRADALIALAGTVARKSLRLEPGSDPATTRQTLLEIDGVDDRLATIIVMRALYWPDAFPFSDRTLRTAVGASSARALRDQAEKWRPWRAYAALHLWLSQSR
jgi:AraC family transcriptional regulator, regulatory protein of adaptative response / DNA-3-methyladenine glycosylase II